MNVEVLLFAAARESAGAGSVRVDLEDGATVGALLDHLATTHPGLGDVLPACRAALDEEFVTRATRLSDGCTVAVLPPVSGG